MADGPGSPAPPAAPRSRRRRIVRTIQVVVSLAIVVGVLPKIADYSAVWATIRDLTWLELVTLLAVTVLNILTYWPQMVAAMPGLTFWQAGVNNQSSTTIANTLPLGGALATGVSYTMFRSWGFTNGEIALEAVVTGVWNTFIKLAMPVVSLAALALTGQATAALVVPTAIGIAVLLVAVALFALMLRSKELARRIGSVAGRAASRVRGLFRKPRWSGA